MNYAEESLRLHEYWKGKIEVRAAVSVATADDLSLAYTPGVAAPCLEIQKAPGRSYDLTLRHNLCAVIFACANPTPEIFPEEARAGGARVIATGRSDFPNQINNVLAFPGIFRGAFDARASDINDEMKLAAANALADLIPETELREDYIIPKAFDPRVGPAVAAAVKKAAEKTGVARFTGETL